MRIHPDHNIALFSLPGNKEFQYIHQHDWSWSERLEEGEAGFVLRPFSQNATPRYLRAGVTGLIDPAAITFELTAPGQVDGTDEHQYKRMVESAIQSADQSKGKVVLSRVVSTGFKHFDIAASLQSLRAKFPQAFVYALHTNSHGLWIGATPETLVEQYDDDFHTMALAGTRALDELFTQKEFDEQMLVTKDILEQLSDVPVEVGDIHEHPYGHIKHLRTLLQWKADGSVMPFAERLHPTPAVAGYPRLNALDTIQRLESYDRSLYTGYLGMIEGSGKSQLFVNLRCLQLFEGQFWYYTGGGINAQSDPTQEWEETEQKKQSVLSALAYE